MTSATTTHRPSEEELYNLARSLAYRMAHRTADLDDLTQEAMWSAHRALRRIRNPRKPFAFARTVMQRSMISYYHKHRRTLLEEPLDDNGNSPNITYNNEPEENDLVLDQYLTTLQSTLGSEARRIAEHLISPRHPRECLFIINEVRRKQKIQLGGRPLIITQDRAKVILRQIEQGKVTLRVAQKRLGLKSQGPIRRALLRLLEGNEPELTAVLCGREAPRKLTRKKRSTQSRGIKKIVLSHRQLRQALNLTLGEWSRLLASIRQFTAKWLLKNASPGTLTVEHKTRLERYVTS